MNRPVHFEIHATDPEAMAKFYSTVFGWNVRHIPEFNYWTFDTGAGGDGINGGMVKRRGEKPRADCPVSAFVCSLGVASVDDALAKALDLGATVALPKMAIPGVGYQAYIKDPDGNILGLHQHEPGAK
jgi:predicted enzyme related to lactoylglutathione lyase